MSQMQIFNHSEFQQIRMVEVDGKPHFVGVDVARTLEYAKPSQAIIDHCKGIRKLGIPSQGGIQETNIIPEGDIYRLVIKAADQSRNPEIKEKAERFERWIFEEILPSIRSTGSYNSQNQFRLPQTFAEALEGYAAQLRISEALDNERKQLASKIEADRPMVIFAESLQVSTDSILIGELAKLLKQNGIDIGGTRLFKQLREDGYLMSKGDQYNMPTQRSMDLKIMEIKAGTRGGSDGAVHITRTTKITGKGQIYFINKFKNSLQLVQ